MSSAPSSSRGKCDCSRFSLWSTAPTAPGREISFKFHCLGAVSLPGWVQADVSSVRWEALVRKQHHAGRVGGVGSVQTLDSP